MPIVAHQRYYDIIIANVFLMKFEIVTYLKYVPPLCLLCMHTRELSPGIFGPTHSRADF